MKLISTISLLFFTTLLCKAQSGTMIDTRDGKVYNTVQIGSQTWMAENLAYRTQLSFVTHDSYIKTGIYCYNDDTSLIANYGLLYSWDVAIKSCPVGWHLPTKAEYDTLLSLVGPDIKIAYEHLKAGGDTGFEATLGGDLSFTKSGLAHYGNINTLGNFWTSTGKSNTLYFYYVSVNSWVKKCSLGICPKFYHKFPTYTFCMSVRCIKNSEK